MYRVLLTLATAGILTAATASHSPAQIVRTAGASQLTLGGDLVKVNNTPSSPVDPSKTAASVRPTKVRPEPEDEGNLNTFGTLLTTMSVMVAIAFRRTRNRKL